MFEICVNDFEVELWKFIECIVEILVNGFFVIECFLLDEGVDVEYNYGSYIYVDVDCVKLFFYYGLGICYFEEGLNRYGSCFFVVF